jgi:hypothetical protein
LLISGALFLVVVPALFLGQVVPEWLAVAGAFLFLFAAIAALVWSYRVYLVNRTTPGRGVPLTGVILGVLVVVLAGLVVVPQAL